MDTNTPTGTDIYDDSAKGGYTYAQKLKMVAEGEMDPKEIGLTDPTEAGLKILEKDPPPRQFADWITFEASEVPLALRALWARQDLTIIPGNTAEWEMNWMEENKNTHRLQCRVRCGTAFANLEKTVTTERMEGFCGLLEDAAKLFRAEHQKQLADAANPPKDTNEPTQPA